jgi:hypothetical protein
MSSTLFCCEAVKPYRPARLIHEPKFTAFHAWAVFPRASAPPIAEHVDLNKIEPSYAIQLVRQVNYGPLESKRYFIPAKDQVGCFVEILEDHLIEANFQKLNA